MSTLDIERFRKVRALMEGGATDGERAAAKSRAEAIATKAGISLKAAMREDDRMKKKETTSSQSSGWWSDSAADAARYWADKYEREQEEKKRQEEAKLKTFLEAEERKRKARFDEAVKKYGPPEPVFAETPQEMRLRTFMEPFATYAKYSNSGELYVDGYIGWGSKYPIDDGFRKLMNEAIPLPADLPGLIAEWDSWEELKDRRYAYESEYEAPRHVWARTDVLEDLIRVTPARHWQDMDVRLKWMEAELDRDRWSDRDMERQEFDRLKADLDFLRTTHSAPPAPASAENSVFGRRTNADIRNSVLSILDAKPDLSDREIARQSGVSPQTVGNWRRRLQARRA